MRTRTIKFFFFAAASVALVTSCSHSSGGFETDSKTGVTYRFIKHDENGVKGADSDFVHAVMKVTKKTASGKDSELYDSHKNGGDSAGNILLSMQKTYNGCLGQGLLMMSPGDSAEFQINADSFFVKERHAPPDRLPPGVTGTTIYTFHIKLSSFESKKQLMDDQNKQRQQYMQKMMARKAQEPSDIAAYLEKNKLAIKPDADSIYYLQKIKGKGRLPQEGDSIQVGYTGMLLDGTIFDQSDKGPGHRTFGLLYSKDQNVIRVIQGWIKILTKMHEGDKVKVLIPSALAYGGRGNGQIQPFTPLIFDMELVSVKSNKK